MRPTQAKRGSRQPNTPNACACRASRHDTPGSCNSYANEFYSLLEAFREGLLTYDPRIACVCTSRIMMSPSHVSPSTPGGGGSNNVAAELYEQLLSCQIVRAPPRHEENAKPPSQQKKMRESSFLCSKKLCNKREHLQKRNSARPRRSVPGTNLGGNIRTVWS